METVEGLILPYGQVGRTTGGPLTFSAGAVLVPKAIDRVKLMRDHTGQPQHSPVGYALDITQRKDGLYGKFAVADTDDGRAAMQDVRSRVRDAFSVELTDVRKQGAEIVHAHLTAVALVSVPAYHNARVDLTASHSPDRKDTATVTTTTTIHAAAAMDDTTIHAADYTTPNTDPANETTGPAPTGATSSEAKPEDQEDPADDDDQNGGEEVTASDKSKRTNLVRPAYLSGRSRKPSLSLSQAADAVLAIQTGGRVDAELADITGTAMGDAEAPGWLGELWEGTAYKRRFAPLVTNRALTNWRVAGWRWVTKPTVDKYAGDKAEIPTNTPTIEDFEAVATRWAGGHDLDRKFYDFKETAFLQSYWRAITEDYAKKSDLAVADYIIANAKAVGSASSLWDGMFAVAESLDDALNVTPTFYIGNPADRRALANMTMNTAPAALDLLGVDLNRIQWSSKVPAGTLIAGHSSAVTNSELPGSPIRVEAEHIARGGRDAALFGYQAIYSENEAGLVKVTLGSAGGE